MTFGKTSSVRRLLELAVGPFVFKRTLPREFGGGQIYTSGRVGGLKYLFRRARDWDPELLNMANRLVGSGNIVWDLGGNVGLFAKAAAFQAGPKGAVFTIEADIDAVALLNRTSVLEDAAHAAISVLPIAVGERNGFLRFAIAKRARASNAIEGFGSTQTGGTREVRIVPCRTLDSLLADFPAPDVLKIDVEGAELQILNGAKDILSKARPKIYCEVTDQTRNAVVELFKSRRYRIWDGADFLDTTQAEPSEFGVNIVAIPVEMA